ncbi:MAG: AglZ/HisF2 family acetamidino modification protein [Candidatus Roizmanbacteria bacterium]|nr:AglZ/HisF2 family acetamidino modification protein [Candidatus Roizmanbacteria bacterium]
MLRIRVIPCLLLKNGGLVKTVKFKLPKYVGDPINAIKIFNEKEVDELILLDTTATIYGKPPPMKIIEEVASECFMPLGYGGGVRRLEDIKAIFNAGVEKIVINSYAFENPDFIRQAADQFGSQSIVVSIDVKKGFLGKYQTCTHSGKKSTKQCPVDFAIQMENAGAGEILLNSIDRDGTMEGYDVDLLRCVSEKVGIPVVACGGAGKLEHFTTALTEGKVSAVAAGSFFVFQGKHRAVLISYPSTKELERIL